MFPGAGAEIYRNEAGEPMGWGYPESGEEYYNPEDYLPDPQEDEPCQRCYGDGENYQPEALYYAGSKTERWVLEYISRLADPMRWDWEDLYIEFCGVQEVPVKCVHCDGTGLEPGEA